MSARQFNKMAPIGLVLAVVVYACWPYLDFLSSSTPPVDAASRLPEFKPGLLNPSLPVPSPRDPFKAPENSLVSEPKKNVPAPDVEEEGPEDAVKVAAQEFVGPVKPPTAEVARA